MKVLITGAAGKLGSAACLALHEAGMELVATDRAIRAGLPVHVWRADVLDREAVASLVADGVDAVVHLANHIDYIPGKLETTYNENVAMNMNVFQAAINAGARKLVFASSIQVVASAEPLPTRDPDERPPYLPMDGDMPPIPKNPYAMSKEAGELMLAYFARVYGVQAVAVRWPWMFPMEGMRERTEAWEKTNPYILQLGFSYLSFPDAARLILAILQTDLPGFRAYMPASKNNMLGRPAVELIWEYFPNVVQRSPIRDGESLVDITRIERETGWSPTE